MLAVFFLQFVALILGMQTDQRIKKKHIQNKQTRQEKSKVFAVIKSTEKQKIEFE